MTVVRISSWVLKTFLERADRNYILLSEKGGKWRTDGMTLILGYAREVLPLMARRSRISSAQPRVQLPYKALTQHRSTQLQRFLQLKRSVPSGSPRAPTSPAYYYSKYGLAVIQLHFLGDSHYCCEASIRRRFEYTRQGSSPMCSSFVEVIKVICSSKKGRKEDSWRETVLAELELRNFFEALDLTDGLAADSLIATCCKIMPTEG